MTENEKLFEALKVIKETCAEQEFCSQCPLFKAEIDGCGVREQNPEDWNINEPPEPIVYRALGE